MKKVYDYMDYGITSGLCELPIIIIVCVHWQLALLVMDECM